MMEENDESLQGVSKRNTQRNNILAAKILAETLKTILEEMEIEHPAAKMLVEVSKTQEKEVGDGTTTVVMIAGKLLENAEKLLDQKIHPTIITKGYMLAEKKSQEILNDLVHEINDES